MSSAAIWIKDNYHYIAISFWLLMILPTILWWKDSVLWVSLMSLYANIWISLEVVMSKRREDRE